MATFSSDPDHTNLKDCVFSENSMLSLFLESSTTAAGYCRSSEATPQRSAARSLWIRIEHTSRRYVLQMASGGLGPPSACLSDEAAQVEGYSMPTNCPSTRLTQGNHTVSQGCSKPSAGTGSSKLEHFEKAQSWWSHWFQLNGKDYHRLQIDLESMRTLSGVLRRYR